MAAATVYNFMFEAGRKSLCAFSSNNTRPLSSDTTLMPTIAAASSGRRKMSEMLICKAGSVFVVVATFGPGVGVGDGAGDAAGVGVGVGTTAGFGTCAGCVTFRSLGAVWLLVVTATPD